MSAEWWKSQRDGEQDLEEMRDKSGEAYLLLFSFHLHCVLYKLTDLYLWCTTFFFALREKKKGKLLSHNDIFCQPGRSPLVGSLVNFWPIGGVRSHDRLEMCRRSTCLTDLHDYLIHNPPFLTPVFPSGVNESMLGAENIGLLSGVLDLDSSKHSLGHLLMIAPEEHNSSPSHCNSMNVTGKNNIITVFFYLSFNSHNHTLLSLVILLDFVFLSQEESRTVFMFPEMLPEDSLLLPDMPDSSHTQVLCHIPVCITQGFN